MKRGFTLIELLVVVLIIGILASIALPQYQKAVLKARIGSMLPLMESMVQANEFYYMVHGEYASHANVTNLDITMPESCYWLEGAPDSGVESMTNAFSCAPELLFDFSDQTGLVLRYCPGNSLRSGEDINTCISGAAGTIQKYYNHSDTSITTRRGKWHCGSPSSPKVRDVIQSLSVCD